MIYTFFALGSFWVTTMDNMLPIVYLALLLALLATASFIILRQVLKTRKIESSIVRLQNKLVKEKGTAKDYYELGSIYLDKKLFLQATNQFQKALKAADEISPEESVLIYNALGFAYFAQEQYDLAIRNYKEALKLFPTYVTALNNLGHAYERKQLTTQALESYSEALQHEPNNVTAKRRAEALRKRVVASA
jgi:tetratricopeptide (TPR) repeat protein